MEVAASIYERHTVEVITALGAVIIHILFSAAEQLSFVVGWSWDRKDRPARYDWGLGPRTSNEAEVSRGAM